MGINTWSDARIELFKALWSDGVPAGTIAEQFGLTRGAIVGKRYRLGLPPRSREVSRVAEAHNGRRTAGGRCGQTWKIAKASPEVIERARARSLAAALKAEEKIQPLQGSNPKPWELRRPGECAFPVAGAGSMVLSCCEPREGRSSYCLGHRELVAGRCWPPVERRELVCG